jgi:hypothetical protein
MEVDVMDEVKFEFDERAFRRALQPDVEERLNAIGRALQRALDDLKATHGGKPVEGVAAGLRSVLAAQDLELPEDHIQAYA